MDEDRTETSTHPKVFRTAFGFPLLGSSTILIFVVIGSFTWVPEVPGGASIVHHALAVALPTFLVYFMSTTKYQVLERVLHLRMGPFRRRIPIDSITSLSEYGIKRGRLYGLGTDIIAIEYEGGPVGVTPKDVDGFVAAVGVPLIQLGGGKVPS